MPIVLILSVAGLLYWLQNWIYHRYWNKNLSVSVKFTDQFMFEGAATALTETITNRKILPLPWIYVKFQISRNGKVEHYRSDLFNILFYQRITREIPFTFDKRGIYTIKGIDLLSHNLFITSKMVQVIHMGDLLVVYPKLMDPQEYLSPYEKMMGEIATKRFLMEDPYMFKGIREYQSSDNFKSINFKASAKAGKLLVNTHDSTITQTIQILLNMEKNNDHYNEVLYEQGIRMAASLASRYEEDGVPVSLYCNGQNVITHKEITVAAGSGANHIHTILESLASLEVSLPPLSPMSPCLEKVTAMRDMDTYTVLISPYYGKELQEAYKRLRSYTASCMWILPVSYKDMADEEFPPLRLRGETEDVYLWEV